MHLALFAAKRFAAHNPQFAAQLKRFKMNHRLQPQKLLKIIAASEKVLGEEDLDVEVEYQNETIGRYGLETDGSNLLLIPKQTNCLAKENCAIPSSTGKENFKPLSAQTACCEPASSCC